ncbi:MAG: assimilatory nitrate reductase electron transfer subunit [Frankiaceae bacterium]|nr:assimilatory nitrate reductase electron transfer subunit [Frankiaceae bacterium]
MTRVVVVGNGMAGSRVVEELRARDLQRALDICVLGAETFPAYNRILLSSVLAGKVTVGDIALTPEAWYEQNDVQLELGVTVARIDRTARVVIASDGRTFGYDELVLATGSRPRVPTVPGFTDPGGDLAAGVSVFRTVGDCERIIAGSASAAHAIVVGGGLLGLEAARGLAGRGVAVTVLHKAGHLMEKQIDDLAGGVLVRTLARLGVDVRLRGVPIRYDTAGAERFIVLADGQHLPADIVVIAAGVEPDVCLARDSGLDVNRAIVVDDRMRTSDPHVWAIGECAEHRGTVYGLVAPAWEHAAVVANALTGAGGASYAGSAIVTRLKASNVDLATMGDAHLEDDETAEVVRFVDPVRGTYKKLVIRDGRLTGAILLGENATVGAVTQLFDRGGPVPSDRITLLFPGRGAATTVENPAHIPDRATVCRCNNVSKRAITKCWLAGARTVAAVAGVTRATTGCGGCRDLVAGIVDWMAAADPDEQPDVPALVTLAVS